MIRIKKSEENRKGISVIKLYEEVVGKGGLSPEYFFDCMTLNECAAFIKRHEPERTRSVGANENVDVRCCAGELERPPYT